MIGKSRWRAGGLEGRELSPIRDPGVAHGGTRTKEWDGAGRCRRVWMFLVCEGVSVSVAPVKPVKQEAKSSVRGEVGTCRQVEEV